MPPVAKRVQTSVLEIAYEDSGPADGVPVFLMHGWGGHSGQMTPFVDPVVTAGFRVVALDLPGHGESAGSVSSLIHFASALVRAAALFRPVHGLVAHSFGAAASTYATRFRLGPR